MDGLDKIVWASVMKIPGATESFLSFRCICQLSFFLTVEGIFKIVSKCQQDPAAVNGNEPPWNFFSYRPTHEEDTVATVSTSCRPAVFWAQHAVITQTTKNK